MPRASRVKSKVGDQVRRSALLTPLARERSSMDAQNLRSRPTRRGRTVIRLRSRFDRPGRLPDIAIEESCRDKQRTEHGSPGSARVGASRFQQFRALIAREPNSHAALSPEPVPLKRMKRGPQPRGYCNSTWGAARSVGAAGQTAHTFAVAGFNEADEASQWSVFTVGHERFQPTSVPP